MALRFLSNYQFLKQPSVVEEIDVCYIYRLPTRREMEAAMDETTTPSTQRQKEGKTERSKDRQNKHRTTRHFLGCHFFRIFSKQSRVSSTTGRPLTLIQKSETGPSLSLFLSLFFLFSFTFSFRIFTQLLSFFLLL